MVPFLSSRSTLTFCSLALLACSPTKEPQDPFARDCEGWCRKSYDCGNGQDPPSPPSKNGLAACVDSCIDAYELEATDLGPSCQDAYVEAMACLSTLSCTEFLDENFGPDGGGECDDVLGPYYDLCPGVFLAPESQQE